MLGFGMFERCPGKESRLSAFAEASGVAYLIGARRTAKGHSGVREAMPSSGEESSSLDFVVASSDDVTRLPTCDKSIAAGHRLLPFTCTYEIFPSIRGLVIRAVLFLIDAMIREGAWGLEGK